MAEERLRSKQEIKKLFTNLQRKGITDEMMARLIDVLWRNKFSMRTSGFANSGGPDAVIAFDPATRIFTITPLDPAVENYKPRFSFYTWNYSTQYQQRYETESITLPDEEGLFFIYYDTDETNRVHQLFYTKNPGELQKQDIYLQKVLISCVYWDATAAAALHFGDDRHGSEWNPQMHLYLHNAFHARRKSGLTLTGMSINGDGSADAHAKLSVTAGVMLHDDFELTIAASTETIPVLYQLGTTPRYLETAGYAIYKGASRICYNTGGAAVEATSGYHVLYHIFATNEIGTASRKIISVMGAGQYEKLAAAYYAVDTELETIAAWMPHQGRFYVGSIVVQTSGDYTNTMAARVVGVVGEQSKSHSPVTIAPASSGLASIDENQELNILLPTPPDGIISPGLVTWITGLTFSVTEAEYYLQGNPFTAPFSLITLDAADATYARIDSIAVDITGSVVVIKGTPAADPQHPGVDPTSQIELTFVLILANATEPEGITDEIIYNENTEWTPTESGVTVDYNSATDPYSGSKCADVGAVGTGDSITFTAGAAKSVADYETLSFFLKLKEAMTNKHYLRVQFFLAGVAVSNILIVANNIGTTGEWLNVALLMDAFTFTGTEFDAVKFDWLKQNPQNDHSGFYLDLVKLQAGITQPTPGTQGPPGEDGLSAYQIALLNGFAGTEVEWLASLVGADGVDGVDGSAGFLVTKKAVLTSQIDGTAVNFILPETPAPKSVLVFLNGVQQFEHQVTVTADIVTFVTAPKVGYHLDVLYSVTLDATLFADTPPEAPDGVRTLFSLASVQTAGTLRVWLNGVRQAPATITEYSGSFEFAVAPKTDWKIRAYYEIEEQAKTYGEIPAGVIDGTNTVFTLANAAIVAAVYLSGVYQHAHQVDVAGDTITFTDAPGAGYVLFVDYSHL